GLAALKQELHIVYGLLICLRRGQVLDARPQTALDVVLQAGSQMIAGEIDFAGRNQEAAVDQIDDAVRQISGEVWTIVDAAVFAQAAGDVDTRVALAQGHLAVW